MTVIKTEHEVSMAVVSLSKAIIDGVFSIQQLVIVGIHTGGVTLALRLQKEIADLTGVKPPCGSLDITLYRDDLFEGFSKPIVGATVLPESIEAREVVLVDDVIYTGRTVRSAMLELMDYGRPKRIRLAVLIDRGHRELPIVADYVGFHIATRADENVRVRLRDSAAHDEVLLIRRGE